MEKLCCTLCWRLSFDWRTRRDDMLEANCCRGMMDGLHSLDWPVNDFIVRRREFLEGG